MNRFLIIAIWVDLFGMGLYLGVTFTDIIRHHETPKPACIEVLR